MLQLWKLVLLCGLLTGTSGSLLGNLGDDLHDAVNNLRPVIRGGLNAINYTAAGVLRNVKGDLEALKKSNKENFQQAINILNDALSKLFSIKNQSLGLKISNVHILNVKGTLTPDGQGLNLRIPASADVTLTLPLIGQTVNLKAALDVLATVRIETDSKTGESKVVLTECGSDPDSVSISLVGRHSALLNQLTDSVSSFLSKTVSFLVQQQACPLLRLFLSTLDASLVQNFIDKAQPGVEVEIHP